MRQQCIFPRLILRSVEVRKDELPVSTFVIVHRQESIHKTIRTLGRYMNKLGTPVAQQQSEM